MTMMRIISLIVLLLMLNIKLSISCSDFQLISEDNTVVVARSMDYWLNLNSHVTVIPRGTFYQSKAPTGNGMEWQTNSNGLEWQTKFGFVAIQPVNIKTLNNVVVD